MVIFTGGPLARARAKIKSGRASSSRLLVKSRSRDPQARALSISKDPSGKDIASRESQPTRVSTPRQLSRLPATRPRLLRRSAAPARLGWPSTFLLSSEDHGQQTRAGGATGSSDGVNLFSRASRGDWRHPSPLLPACPDDQQLVFSTADLSSRDAAASGAGGRRSNLIGV